MRFSITGIVLAAAIAVGGGAVGAAQAAGPMPVGAAAATQASAANLVQQVQYYGYGPRRYYGGRRYYPRPRYYGGPRYGYRPRTVCGWRWQPSPWGPRRVRVCWRR